ncbi:T-cell activation inhibitor, mitochondrial [Scaptodrosophila lebanonensis]|uniref:T-cell activation inhibitor, mitochondrial n=1 Tax=Drosophila lebanonensis TaxID=7225 RepID=A0A6J2UDN5_DROLE|nr:T-cell activation inhibitor, mitochondrial [Scaptodrosophila lebanonensis]
MAWNFGLVRFQQISSLLMRNRGVLYPLRRTLNTDLSMALRPFVVAVHPDYFGKYPVQRHTNEESLKQLNAHLESLSDHKFSTLPEKKVLKFYMRVGSSNCEAFRIVLIEMNNNLLDPKAVVQEILETCNLTAECTEVEKPALEEFSTAAAEPGLESNFMPKEIKGGPVVEKQVIQSNLDKWLNETAARAHLNSEDLTGLKAEVRGLEKSLVQKLGLRATRYDCGWNLERYHDCLISLEQLAKKHAKELEVLRNRIVAFAPYTGISLDGDVMLFTGDEPKCWFWFINAMGQHETYLKLVPLYEQALSAVLRGIQIKRRNYIPSTEAKTYANRLLRIINSISDYLNAKEYLDQLPESLKDYKLAIVPEDEQPKVSFTGLFLVPATSSGQELIDFIASNLEIARNRVIRYKKDRAVERELWKQCKDTLCLHNLTKDDSVTPDKMILTLRHLLKSESKSFRDISVHVTNYYSVMTDGIVCIPWDFMYRKAERKSQ